MSYQIELSYKKNDKFSDFLKNKIVDFNNTHSKHHAESRKEGSVQPIIMMVSDDRHHWIGGITAEVYWNWVKIHYFWIAESYRAKGLGSQLLAKTEGAAIDLGAEKALLTTYEFQARTFYEEHGFQVVGEVKDYPPGSSYFTMVKELI